VGGLVDVKNRLGVTGAVALVVALSCASCGGVNTMTEPTAKPSDTTSAAPEAAEPESPTDPAPLDSLGFDDGALIDPAAYVGWSFSFGSEEEWTPAPGSPEGTVEFVHANGSCTARYIQEIIATSSSDDAEASDEFLAALTGDTVESNAAYVFDGHFALTGTEDDADGTVANRAILLGSRGSDLWLVAVRVFSTFDTDIRGMSNAYTLELNCVAGIDPEDVVDSLDAVAAISVGS
jgi:hypothetical protein